MAALLMSEQSERAMNVALQVASDLRLHEQQSKTCAALVKIRGRCDLQIL